MIRVCDCVCHYLVSAVMESYIFLSFAFDHMTDNKYTLEEKVLSALCIWNP